MKYLILICFLLIACSNSIKSLESRPNDLSKVPKNQYCLGECCNRDDFPYVRLVKVYEPTFGELYENDTLYYLNSAKLIPEIYLGPEEIIEFSVFFTDSIKKPLEYYSEAGGDMVLRVWGSNSEICKKNSLTDDQLDMEFNKFYKTTQD